MPVVMPLNKTLGLLRAFTIMGTNGGEQIALTEVTIKVSLSTFAIRQSKACKTKLPMTVPNKNMATVASNSKSFLRSAIDATTMQNTKIKYMPIL